MYTIGLDIGTQSAKVIVCAADGKIIAQSSEKFENINISKLLDGWFEQDPYCWWLVSVKCLREVIEEMSRLGIKADQITAIAVDSTSGTVVPADANGKPLYPALMYNDSRSAAEAEECNSAGHKLIQKLGYRFASSFALPKILWVKHNKPDLFNKTDCFIHAADYIVGRLSGNHRVSDTSNALKTGYDLVDKKWPDFIESKLDIPLSKLPDVVDPGNKIGAVTEECAAETGLHAGTAVIAGVTDGTAGFLASGAAKVGDWNTTIGTTLVIRGVSKGLINDPLGRIYCHAHPQGFWLPGGASNVGAECIAKLFHGKDLDEMNAKANTIAPSSVIVFPLIRRGERLPFINHDAEGFVIGEPKDEYELYTAYLQGVGFVERWCYDLMNELGAAAGDVICSTGGGARSNTWMQIRADILNKSTTRPVSTECAVGTAVVAASKTLYDNLESAGTAMIKISEQVGPNKLNVNKYEDIYLAFREECTLRGYI